MGIFDLFKFGGDKRNKQVDAHIKALKHSSLVKRGEAVKALGELRDPRSVEPLIEVLNDPNEEFRVMVVKNLGKMGDSRAVQPLITCLKDSSGIVRSFAAGALGSLGDKKAISPLVRVAFADEDEETRADARNMLAKLDGPPPETSTAPGTLRYYNEEWNFSLSYPADWEVLREGEILGAWAVPISVGRIVGQGWLQCMVNARRDEILKGNSATRVTAIGPDGQTKELPSNPQEFMEMTKRDMNRDFPGFELISAEEIRIDNKPAARIMYSRGEEGNEIYEEYTTLFGVGTTFLFICEVPRSESAKYRPAFKEFVENFRVGRDTPESPIQKISALTGSSRPVEVYNAGVAHYRNGDFKRAMSAFEEGIKLVEYSLQSAYARCMCQKQLGLTVDLPSGFEGDQEAVGPVYLASNIACHIIAGGHRAAVTKAGAHAEIEAVHGSSRYLIHVDDMLGQFITNVWRIEGGKEIHISDSSVNPKPTEGDKFILSLTRAGTSLPLAAMPLEGLKSEL